MNMDPLLEGFLTLSPSPCVIGHRAGTAAVFRIAHVNDACLAAFRMPVDDLLGQPMDMLLDAERGSEVQPPNTEAGAHSRIETECRRADGSSFPATLSMTQTTADDGAGGVYTLWLFETKTTAAVQNKDAAQAIAERDRAIAKQQGMTEELLQMQDRLYSVMNAYPMPFAVFDKDRRLVLFNEPYRNAVASVPEQIHAGMHIEDIIGLGFDAGVQAEPSGGREAYIKSIMESINSGELVQDIESQHDTHTRLARSIAENGDLMVLRIDITDFVRQRRAMEQSQHRLLSALNAYPDPFSIFDADAVLVTCNTAYQRDVCPSDPDIVQPGLHMRDIIALRKGGTAGHPENDRHDPIVTKVFQFAREGSGTSQVMRSGETRYRVIRCITEIGDLVSLQLDITAQVRGREEAEAAHNRLLALFTAFPDPAAIYDAEDRLLMWNTAYAQSISQNPGDVKAGMTARELLLKAAQNGEFPDARGREEAWVDDYVGRAKDSAAWDSIGHRDDRHYRILRSASASGELLVLRLDITENVRQRRDLQDYANRLEAANTEITHKALHDELTGLGNRRFLTERFAELRREYHELGGRLAALHIDLDRFKQINDTIGHAAGDHVLIEVARRIRRFVRAKDIVARIGGDEFVILLRIDNETRRASELADALIKSLSMPFLFEGRECRIGASVGIAMTPFTTEDNLLTSSDIALYKAKNRGRGTFAIFDHHDVEELRRTKEMADDILRGLENREFVPFYQPQVDPFSGQLLGVEALARWRHPQKGILSPAAFISVAEDLNVVADIDRMIFETAMTECRTLFADTRPWPSLSFNVSAKRIKDGEFDAIGSAIGAYPGEIAFELLETIFLEEEGDGFLMQVDRLRDMGITIEVDDFGSGRASIVSLQRIGPDRLKIDGRLVMPIERGNSAARLVQSIIEIGNVLGIGVTAEGVETLEQVHILGELGADRLQGYYFSPPLSQQDLQHFLKHPPVIDRAASA